MTTAGTRATGALFVATILTGSFLLFLVQPMIARMALPKLGGAPAVWNSAMLVYQALLLGGYAYAHWLGQLPGRIGAAIHIALLLIAALWLPIGLIGMDMPRDAEPVLWVPWLLFASIGPLFLAVSAQAPLMQRWFSRALPGRDPYALYAASNLGSFGGLLAYPLIVEPLATLRVQGWVWSGGYILLALLVVGCALLLPRGAREVTQVTSPATPRARVALWIALACVPSGLMLATSTFLTTDIVAVPLLWVLPLGLYLLSFTVAFATRRGLADALTRFAPLTILMFGGLMISGGQDMPFLTAALALILLFMVAVALHTRLYALRPEPDRLTGFYLAMSVGGALGGVFAALIAPVLFDWTYEYPILILAAGLLVPQAFLLPVIGRLWAVEGQARRIRVLGVTLLVSLIALFVFINPGESLGQSAENFGFLAIAAIGILTIGVRPAFMVTLAGALLVFGGWRALQISIATDARTRSYFGVYTTRSEGAVRTLAHGTTLHGLQLLGSPERERVATTYYVPGSGVGRAMLAAPTLYGPQARIGVVGLGTGTLACYARPGQRWRVFEIDPAVVHIARDSGQFRFLSRCLPDADIVIGDARTRLAEQAPASFDVLVLDAFSSDAVPMHLMTSEAFDIDGRALAPNGLLLVHISNRYLDLKPVVAAAARAGGWHARRIVHRPPPEQGAQSATSDWIAMSRDPATIAALTARGGGWEPLEQRRGFRPWSDDYATILPLLRSLN